MADLIDSAITRSIKISPNGKFLLILEKQTYPSITELSKPVIRLAGLYINPMNNAAGREETYTSIKIKSTESSELEFFEDLPENIAVSDVQFSPDTNIVAFTNTTASGVQLWIGNLNTRKSQKLSELYLNNTLGRAYQWNPDGQTILAKFLVENRGDVPQKSRVPIGPYVQQNLGGFKPTKTYQDLLRDEFDIQLFDYYVQSQLKTVSLYGELTNFGTPGLHKDFDVSPDGNYYLVSTLMKPYSYAVPVKDFSFAISLENKYGKVVRNLDTIPLADNLPNGFDAVVKGPREFGWRADQPNVYYWVEAQDGGNPAKRAEVRDIVYTQSAEIGPKNKLTFCYYRFNRIDWGDDNIAIITEKWFKTRAERRVFINPHNRSFRVNLWDRYYENNYDDPGQFVTIKNSYNKDVLLTEYINTFDDERLNVFSYCDGGSPEGNVPFVLKFNVKTKLRDSLAKSKAPAYEKPVFFNNKGFVIGTSETATENPNYYLYSLKDSTKKQLTFFSNPNQQLFGIQRQQLNYIRKDSLNLSATLYLPKDYNLESGKLPVLMWAYPREYKTAKAAGQIKNSPYQFSEVRWSSPIFWVTQGYAVLDDVDMPIVGESNNQPNDTFIDQLTQNAEAAVKAITDLGIADKARIAIGGHSYGAFMTANLMAHTTLFAAGIARSGAYNRTLTPFGFQSEERTLWEAPLVYGKMSPFNYAHKIKKPLLLIHGEADDNMGTFPMQSERFYNALKANGATTRLVILPSEAQNYKAKESIWHTLWEMDSWLFKYVKNKNITSEKK